MPINATSVLKYEYAKSESIASSIQPNASSIQPNASITETALLMQSMESSELLKSKINIDKSDSHRSKRSMSSILTSSIISSMVSTATNTVATSTATAIIQPTQIILQTTTAKLHSNISDISKSKSIALPNMHTNARANMDESSKGAGKTRNDAIIGRISILIHNISVISSVDEDYLDNSEREWMYSTKR